MGYACSPGVEKGEEAREIAIDFVSLEHRVLRIPRVRLQFLQAGFLRRSVSFAGWSISTSPATTSVRLSPCYLSTDFDQAPHYPGAGSATATFSARGSCEEANPPWLGWHRAVRV